MTSPRAAKVDETIASPFYRNDSIRDHYNALTFRAAKDWRVEFRAYNDGVAYRWVYTGRKPVKVASEKVEYSFSGDPGAIVSYLRNDGSQWL